MTATEASPFRNSQRISSAYSALKDQVKTLGTNCLDLLLPNLCILCKNQEPSALCKNCLDSIPIEISQQNSPHLDKLYTLTPYSEQLKTLLAAIKFKSNTEIAHYLATQIQKHLSLKVLIEEQHCPIPDLFLPIPIHKSREKRRGFNQVQHLFGPWIRENALAYESIVQRHKHTPPLFELRDSKREEALHNAFSLKQGKQVQGASIVILDDIITTGATLATMAQYLRQEGAKQIIGLCLCNARLGNETNQRHHDQAITNTKQNIKNQSF